MDIKELIESGSLELYVMGALTAEETRQIDELRKTSNELNAEIEKVEDALNRFATLHARKPDAALKDKIASQLSFADEKAEPKVVAFVPSFYRYAVAASVALVVVLASSTFYFYNKYNEASRRILALQSEKDVLAKQVQFNQTEFEKTREQLAVVSNPANKAVILKGLPISPTSQAVVYWNSETGIAYINATQLPQIAENEQFQLWAIVEGKPVDMGVVSKDTAFSVMKNVKGAVAFAITLEPLGGKPTPTLEKMYVLGNV